MTEPTVTYAWRIERLDAAPREGRQRNVVHNIHWRLLGTDGVNTLDLYGTVPLSEPNPKDFTPYDELTEESVVSWLEAAIDANAGAENATVAQMRESLARMLAAQRKPSVVPMPAPWDATAD